VELLLAVATILGGIAAMWFFLDKIALWFSRTHVTEQDLSGFIRDGQRLRERSREDPIPIAEHNAWVERMTAFFKTRKGHGYDVRLNDFSGMTFLGDESDRSKFERSIDGRIRRLHEFLKEL
jgi:hypothetical protein